MLRIRFSLATLCVALGEKEPAHKDTVTVRDRDTMQQERVPIKELRDYLEERLA